MLLKLLTTLCLLALYGSVFAADCYVWQREHTPYVKRAVKEFHNFFCGRLLYLAGEIIDVDAYTGGYNLQIAFSTGYLAGKSAAEY